MGKFSAISSALDQICKLEQTPLLLVNSKADGVLLPPEVRENGDRTVLNISATAVRDFVMDEFTGRIEFQTRFNGVSTRVIVPLEAVLAVYSAEGTPPVTWHFGQPAAKEKVETPSPGRVQGRPTLTLIQGGRK